MDLVNCSMVLEGGAIKGVFTAGILDYLMEKNFYTKYVVGVSAGACNAVDYVSKQIGRSKNCFIPTQRNVQYINKKNLFLKKPIYDMDLVFEKFPLEVYPFDFDTYYASPMECELVVTNCSTGKAEYLTESEDRNLLMKICRASCSMPFISNTVYIGKTPYLDGGIADSIPFQRAIDKGFQKHIIVLTKNYGYRRRRERMLSLLSVKKYKDHPAILEVIEHGWRQYNQTMDQIEKMEKEGSIFVLRPKMKTISGFEQNPRKTTAFYQDGYATMHERFHDLQNYLK